jgi:uncharacterized membrane protein YeaQ/YmgE (transglycosylase-associated protein family)
MTGTELLVFLIVGAVAGWLAGNIMRGGGFGLIGNIIVGIVGSFLGRWIFGALHISLVTGLLGWLSMAVIGAVVLLFIVGLIKRA